MQVGPDGVVVDTAFPSVFGVVATACQHLPERLGAGVQVGAAAVVLESHQGMLTPLYQQIVHRPHRARLRDVVEADAKLGSAVNGIGVEDAETYPPIAP